MTDSQLQQLRQIMAVADVRMVVFDSSTGWQYVRVTYVIGGVWFNETIQPSGAASDRTMANADS